MANFQGTWLKPFFHFFFIKIENADEPYDCSLKCQISTIEKLKCMYLAFKV